MPEETAPNACQRVSKPQWKKLTKMPEETAPNACQRISKPHRKQLAKSSVQFLSASFYVPECYCTCTCTRTPAGFTIQLYAGSKRTPILEPCRQRDIIAFQVRVAARYRVSWATCHATPHQPPTVRLNQLRHGGWDPSCASGTQCRAHAYPIQRPL